ncbi:hypothetical protein ISCGN_029535 [Ixodes scapularis]
MNLGCTGASRYPLAVNHAVTWRLKWNLRTLQVLKRKKKKEKKKGKNEGEKIVHCRRCYGRALFLLESVRGQVRTWMLCPGTQDRRNVHVTDETSSVEVLLALFVCFSSSLFLFSVRLLLLVWHRRLVVAVGQSERQ